MLDFDQIQTSSDQAVKKIMAENVQHLRFPTDELLRVPLPTERLTELLTRHAAPLAKQCPDLELRRLFFEASLKTLLSAHAGELLQNWHPPALAPVLTLVDLSLIAVAQCARLSHSYSPR